MLIRLTGVSAAIGAAQSAPQAVTGGPDQFGYIDTTEPTMTWIDATGGTNLHLDAVQLLCYPLPFSFPFYEDFNNQLCMSSSAILTFDPLSAGYLGKNLGSYPDPNYPNNLIVPFVANHLMSATPGPGNAYVLEGGTVPDRFVVFEWYQVGYYMAEQAHFRLFCTKMAIFAFNI